VPFAVTVDHETLENNTVTIRNRDNLKQTRIPINNIYKVLKDLLEGRLDFENI
jgi:glycyl-tRNA synthetase